MRRAAMLLRARRVAARTTPRIGKAQQQRMRHKAQNRCHEPVAEAGNDHAAAAQKAAIAFARHLNRRQCERMFGAAGLQSGARLELGRSTGPGQSAVTRMPRSASSRCNASLNDST